MRFPDFLRTTVLISAAAATVLAAVTLAGVNGNGDTLVLELGGGWWLIAALIGLWLGRRASTNPPIAALLANARVQASLPELNPARAVLNRLWPLLVSTVGAGALAFTLPAGSRRGDRVRDHLVARVAPPVLGGDRDRGARRGALLRRADIAAAPDQAGQDPGVPQQPV